MGTEDGALAAHRAAAHRAAAALAAAVRGRVLRTARGHDVRVAQVRHAPTPPPLGAFLLDAGITEPTTGTGQRHLLDVLLDRETPTR
jgi:hypothetical protein